MWNVKFCDRLLIAPITALHFVQDNTLLAGEGPILHVYNVDSQKETSSAKVLPHASIHGLKSETGRHVKETNVCVFGGKSVCVISLVEPRQSVQCLTDAREFEDWVWDVQWLRGDNKRSTDEDDSLALALGHNSVVEWLWRKDVILHHVHCEEKCILYCAKFIGSSWDHLVLAAGTVFNQVALWSVGGHVGKRAKVLHRLMGHQGVIFAIDFHRGRMQICSASDDRSIRLWQLHCHNNGGRLSSDEIVTCWDDVTFEELFVFYGHSARVWGARLLTDHIVSVGEDATCVIWNYNGEVLQKFKGHKGKSIWSLAVNPSETALATGGGDSSVRLWRHLKGSVELNQRCRQQTLHLPHSSASTQTVTEEDFPRSVQMLSDHNLLIMTNSGSLWLHQLTIGQSTHLLKDTRFASYSVLAAAPDGHCVLIGSMYGWLKILPMQGQVFSSTVVSNRSYEEQIHRDGKIYAINWLSTNAGTDGYQFLTTGPEGALTVWRLCSDQMTSGHLVVSGQRLYQFLLPYTKQRWVTAALLLASNDILVCGDRGGTVHTFCLTGQQQNPQQSFKKIHGKAGVTDIRYHDDHVYSCGRDGQFRKYTTDKNGLHLLCSNKVFKGFDWISRLLFHAGDLLVLGFHTDQFLVYSVGRNQRMLTVSCGGGHRVWDFVLSHGGDGRFVYIKNKDIVVCDASFLANQLILKPSLHGREVTDIKYLFSSTDDGSCFVATASEDTTVNILHVSKCPIRDGQLRYMYHVVASMQAHISNVRALCVSASDHSPDSVSGNFLLFSAGGRAQLNVWKIYFQEDNVGCGTKVRDSPSGKESGVSTMEKTVGENASPWGVRVATGEMEQVEGDENTVHMDAVSCEGRNVNRTSNNTPCHLLKARTGDSVLAYDSHKTGSSSYNRDALRTPPDIRVDDLRHRHSGGSTALTGGATCWQKHIASHMLLQKERHRKSWKKTTCNSSPETRYMDVCAFSLTDLDHSLSPHGHVLTAACSDGYIRIFRFDESDGTFCLIAQSDFHDHCVLVVRHFIITTLANNRRAYILSAGTDGRIAFWDIADIMTECTHSEEKHSSGATNEEFDNFHQGLKQPSMTTGFPASHALTVENASEIRTNLADMSDSQYNLDSVSPESTRETGKDLPHDKSDQCDTGDDDMNFEKEFPLELEPVFMLDAHQSGINAVDVRIVKEGSYSRLVVASGGDDNALNVSVIARTETDEDKTPTLELLDTTKIHTAHSAQITGLKILDDSTIVTSSIDQRVAVWSLAMQPKLQLQIQACHCIDISDAVGLDVFTDKNGLHHLAVCGVGVQCLEMTTSQC